MMEHGGWDEVWGDPYVSRFRVPGGWIYRVIPGNCVFVPDPPWTFQPIQTPFTYQGPYGSAPEETRGPSV